MPHNHLCPDHTSHHANVVEIMFPAGAPERLSAEDSERADALAQAEYLACEGHS